MAIFTNHWLLSPVNVGNRRGNLVCMDPRLAQEPDYLTKIGLADLEPWVKIRGWEVDARGRFLES
jgi:hypothetical protein